MRATQRSPSGRTKNGARAKKEGRGWGVACVADETKPWYRPSANQRPNACSAPRVLPGFSIIGSNWPLHMAVLSCTVIGRVDPRGTMVTLSMNTRYTT